MQLLRQHGQPMPCPIPGCSQFISKDILSKNHLLAQKVNRVKQQEAQKGKDKTAVSITLCYAIKLQFILLIGLLVS
jgi:hypothetical protein